MPIDEIKNFIPVSDRLGTAGQPSEAQLRDVAGAGFEVVSRNAPIKLCFCSRLRATSSLIGLQNVM